MSYHRPESFGSQSSSSSSSAVVQDGKSINGGAFFVNKIDDQHLTERTNGYLDGGNTKLNRMNECGSKAIYFCGHEEGCLNYD